jgi:predicted ATP-grasp superfamily ATP-dependent carboligase
VISYAAAQGIGVVLPVTEASLLAVLAVRDRLREAAVPFPTIDVFRSVSDKLALAGVAGEVGIAYPRQWVIKSRDDAVALDLEALPFPVVLKPSRSVGEANGARSKQRVRHARDADEFRARVATLSQAAFPLLVQRRIVGPGQGVFLLRWNGVTVAAFAHRRLLEKPPSGGISVYAEAVPLDPMLVEQSERLLAAYDWQGVAMIEYKIDAATGTAYLMEINGRFWGSLQLAIDAGVDFPRLLVECVLGEPTPVRPGYRVGQRGRWWWGEVDHVLARLRRSDAQLALPEDTPSRGRTVAQFLARWRPGERDAVFQLTDPLPFLHETVRWVRRQ